METIEDLKSEMAVMFGVSVRELGDPFVLYRELPEPIKYKCEDHGWWYPSDNICCPGCRQEMLFPTNVKAKG